MARDKGAQTAAKARYNRKHYEQVMLRVPVGARCTVQDLADVAGLSVAEYIRHCIICDAMRRGYDVTAALGGGATWGGGVVEHLTAAAAAARDSRGRSPR